ncbi:MAG: HD-GYP domain-containing protein [Lachnospiraceae bacterium]|nr:HD-GYP domain-containing protein [Lachnospiraceae bacterium]
MNNNRKINKPFVIWFILFLALYMTVLFLVTSSAGSESVITIRGTDIPVSAFAGVFSSLANTLLIFMVVFFRKPGFITSIIIIISQLPFMVMDIVSGRSLSGLPGIFGNLFTIIAVIIVYRRNKKISEYRKIELEHANDRQLFSQHLFEQTATALVNAIDAKDEYSRGHSLRVAEYSERIARKLGKSSDECYKIYYAALLHDVGKIGIDDSIINKKGRLTPEEYEAIKQHTVIGNQILSWINEYPYLSIGAHYHHERYDGKGYPSQLKGEDIPEIARIISVADAYDAMTSNRSYRKSIPQQLVREEIIKGAGTQFDPAFATVMQELIDLDPEYRMRERNSVRQLAGRNELKCAEYMSSVSDGIQLTRSPVKIHLAHHPDGPSDMSPNVPSIILFDSLDGRIHTSEKEIADLNYFEYCVVRLDGTAEGTGARAIKTDIPGKEGDDVMPAESAVYDIEAVKCRDHVLISIKDGVKTANVTVALPDSSRFAFISLTGEHCLISDVMIETSDAVISDSNITRIADEISYIDSPEGDIPNVQIDGHRTAYSKGIMIENGVTFTFHSMSLPTARLVWHCPFVVIYSSSDGTVTGSDYREYAVLRFDGECYTGNAAAENELIVNRTYDFTGWNNWKKANKEGIDCTLSLSRIDNKIITLTENLGLSVKNTTSIKYGSDAIYAALTGDQCALTGIKISR